MEEVEIEEFGDGVAVEVGITSRKEERESDGSHRDRIITLICEFYERLWVGDTNEWSW